MSENEKIDLSVSPHEVPDEERLSLEAPSIADELLKPEIDVEAQQQTQAPVEHFVSTRTKLIYLAVYFVLNLALTLSNKAVLGKVRHWRLLLVIIADFLRRLHIHGYSQHSMRPQPP